MRMPRGGHFPALEEPELLQGELSASSEGSGSTLPQPAHPRFSLQFMPYVSGGPRPRLMDVVHRVRWAILPAAADVSICRNRVNLPGLADQACSEAVVGPFDAAIGP